MTLFPNFEASYVPVKSPLCGDLKIHVLKAGSGAPVVLLHGYPQTSFIYHKMAQKLVDAGYTCIIPDLRGYGRSDKPKAGPEHAEYSKREMANDIVQVVKHFGYQKFDLIAHDRGARTAHRLVLDHPGLVRNLMLLDICPTLYMFEHVDQEFATKHWHWFFQLLPTAEQLIGSNPEAYFKTATRNHNFHPEARKDYLDSFSRPEAIHASCEDYRAAASIDLQHDREDRKTGNKIQVEKARILWADQGLIPIYGDVVGVWKQWCDPSVEVSGRAVPSNHYIPEVVPDIIFDEIRALCPIE